MTYVCVALRAMRGGGSQLLPFLTREGSLFEFFFMLHYQCSTWCIEK